MQKTNFRFEAIVHDDASTDGTVAIIKEYAEKYPDIIKPIYETENQYSKQDGSLRRILDAHTHGKYVAMCEGDDYWTDPYKLQKQVDFLESHPDYVMCSHKWDELLEDEKKTCYGNPTYVNQDGETYNLNDFVHGKWCCQPLTIMYRASALDLQYYSQFRKAKDITLIYLLLKQGKGYCFPEVMGTYRIHANGIWSGINLDDKRLQDFSIKKTIYDVEQTKEAVIFILYEFTKLISRIWMIKHIRMFVDLYNIFTKHLGFGFTVRLYLNKFFFNKVFSFEEEKL